ncbi:SDR family oxidoreductase [Palleronia sp. LCG004]|uniref:SDR family oxidoreductase n=1 Tax=Palleronia sp. LCG004 TaxID=3079304 RepID=UPI00294261FA|nr:SDR family oxidoreductase [Palleronia sp. LCG004]WOI55239.1 SDR family oxidoreductase [Palleronia sp. LCG004]
MTDRHADTRTLILGGTQGVGLAIARRLAAEGCRHLIVTGRDAARGEAAAAGIGARFVASDLSDTDATTRVVDEAAEAFGRLDAMVVAGALTDRGSILDATPETFDAIMATNVRSPFFALQRFAQRARAAGHSASVVNILSIVIHGGQSFLAPYAASKAALANVTRNAASTLAPDRIRVNGINIGWMDTPGEDAVQRKFHGGGDDWLARAEASRPMGTLVKPDHVAALAAYMLSAEAGVMTGALVDFDQLVPGIYPE